VGALVAQGIISLGLVILGGWRRRGFDTLVEYMSPVFWLFFLLTGISLFVLRHKDPNRRRPFRVPLYPLTPILFCAVSAYMLWSSVAYTGLGAFVGVGVLLAGFMVLLASRILAKSAI
jgi:amino acid transporter